MKKMISLIVPVYGELDNTSYLVALLETIKDFQDKVEPIIIFDDTGTDRSHQNFKVISKYCNSEAKIQRSIFGSPGKARNYGLEIASGEWVVFCDADDSPNIQEIISMINLAIKQDKDTCIGSYTSLDLKNGKTKYFGIQPGNVRFNYRSIADSPGIWRFAFKRSSLENITFPDLRMGEDQVFLIEYFSYSRSFLFYKPVVYTYNVGFQGQLTANRSVQKNITNAMKLSIRKFKQSTSSDLTLLQARMIINQALTSIKYGNIKEKLFSLRIVFGFAFIYFTYLIKNFRSSNSTKRSVVVLMGGLGNQLFQIASGLEFAKTSEVILEGSMLAPRRNGQLQPEVMSFNLPNNVAMSDQNCSLILKRILGFTLRISTRSESKKYRVVLNNLFLFFFKITLFILLSIRYKSLVNLVIPREIGWQSNLKHNRFNFLLGYFQSYKWLENATNIHEITPVSKESENSNIEFYKDLSKTSKPIVLHVRQGDYKYEDGIGILPKSYYLKALNALKKVVSSRQIWVFSDEINEAKKILRDVTDFEILFVDDEGMQTDEIFEIMRLGHSYIIANSTFSYWTATLSRKPNAEVFYPQPWFQNAPSPRELCPKHWTPVEV